MTVSLKHQFVSNVADSPDATLVQPSNWNAEHTLTANADSLLGAVTTGNVTEITCTSAGRALLDDADASAQRTTLGLGTISTQNSNNVSITGGSITGITDLAVADGGTGASTAAGAATNLGLGTGDSPQFAAVNIGNATDTTITRVSAGVIAVEGKTVVTETGGQTVQFAAGSNTAPSITTTGDTNTGIYFPAADTTAITTGGTERMRIDSSGNVGIGTASPSQKLHVSGVGYFTDEIRGSNNLNLDKATLNTIFFTDALALAKSGTGERMRIDTSGNVGIGTTTPLNWGGSSLTLNQVSLSPTYGVYTANAYYGGSPTAWRYGGNGIAWGIGNNFSGVTNGTTIAVAASNSGGANASLTWIPAFNIDSSGNVGIGTSSPSYKLHVSGSFYIINGYAYLGGYNTGAGIYPDTSSGLAFGSNLSNGLAEYNIWNTNDPATYTNTGISFIQKLTSSTSRTIMYLHNNGNVGIGTSSPNAKLEVSDGTVKIVTVPSAGAALGSFGTFTNHPLTFATNNTERMRIDSSGYVFINETATQGTASRLTITAAASSVYGATIKDSGTTYASTTRYMNFVNSTNAVAGSIQHTAATTTAFSTSSDARLKENIVDAPSAIDIVSKIPVRSYDWKEDGLHVQFGFVAQELEQIYTEPVGVGGDDVNSNPWSIEYGRLTPLLVKALQELKADFDAYKSTHP